MCERVSGANYWKHYIYQGNLNTVIDPSEIILVNVYLKMFTTNHQLDNARRIAIEGHWPNCKMCLTRKK